MANEEKVIVTKSKLDALATSISTKSGQSLPMTIAQMKSAVDGISGGSISITDVANSTGITCVITTGARPEPEPSVTWETVFDGQATLMGTEEEPYFWLPSSDDIYPVEGERWRITFQGVEYIGIATYESRVSSVCIGNPAVRDPAYDGSGCPIYLFNAGFGALMGGAAPQYGLGTYQLKLEREVSAQGGD